MLPHLRSDPIRTFLDAADRYGDLVHLKAGPYHGFLLSEPADIKHVLQDNARNYHKSPLFDRLRDVVGNGLLTSEDSLWFRQRRLAQPAFHRRRLIAMADVIVACTMQMLERWDGIAARGETIEIVEEMMTLTQAIIVRTMFSTDLGATAAIVNRTWPIINRRIGETFWATKLETTLPLPANRRFWRALGELDTVVYRIITDRRQAGRDEQDLLSMLLSARDEENGAGMTDRQLRDEVLTMLLAGHETTSLALSWTYYLLGQHPDVERSIADEVRRVIDEGRPGFAHLEQLASTRQVIQESLRLYPPLGPSRAKRSATTRSVDIASAAAHWCIWFRSSSIAGRSCGRILTASSRAGLPRSANPRARDSRTSRSAAARGAVSEVTSR